MSAPKIAIVDDHPLYRLGIQSVLNDKLPEITVVGEYASAKELSRTSKGDYILIW